MTLTSLLRSAHALPHTPLAEPFIFHNQLDITKVTARLFVGSEPISSQHPQVMYKNSINDVLKFLNLRWKQRWMIFNLQHERSKYDDCQVFGNVVHFPIPDHFPPPLAQLGTIVETLESYLDSDPRNVAFIHCKAGKGRSGTIVCAYLMKKYKLSSEDANAYYTSRRIRFPILTEGVSICSQKRYLKYWEGGAAPCRRWRVGHVTVVRDKVIAESGMVLSVGTYTAGDGDRYETIWEGEGVAKIGQKTEHVIHNVEEVVWSDIRVAISVKGRVEHELCSFWVNCDKEASPVEIGYKEMDGYKGLGMKLGMRALDKVVLTFEPSN